MTTQHKWLKIQRNFGIELELKDSYSGARN